MPERGEGPLILCRVDIGACFCDPDAPERCRWDDESRQWVGPCIGENHGIGWLVEVEPDRWQITDRD